MSSNDREFKLDSIGLATLQEISSVVEEYRRTLLKLDDGPRHWAIYHDRPGSQFKYRGIIGIPSHGCSFARTPWKGCFVCGHCLSSLWNCQLTVDAIIEDVRKSISALSKYRPPIISLYTSGSFLDDQELPEEARMVILDEIDKLGWVRKVMIESLPQFIREENLSVISKYRRDISFSIGMGLDSTNDFVRYFCFHRCVSRNQYEKAIDLCNELGLETVAYIVHKPPFLSKEEAIHDTSESIVTAFNMGFSSVSIEPIAIQAGTLQELLMSFGLYEEPTIWSLAAVLINSSHFVTPDSLQNVILGGQVFTPMPYKTLHACKECLSKVHNRFKNLKPLLKNIPVVNSRSQCCSDILRNSKPISQYLVLERANKILSILKNKINNKSSSITINNCEKQSQLYR